MTKATFLDFQGSGGTKRTDCICAELRAALESLCSGMSPTDPRYMRIYPHHIDPRPPPNMWNFLPTELWDAVLMLLEFKDLLSLSLVNKHLRQHAEHILYSEISYLPNHDFAESWHPPPNTNWKQNRKRVFSCIPQPPKLLLLLRTFLYRPELALFVKRIEFITPYSLTMEAEDIFPFWGPRTPGALKLTDDEIELAWTIIKKLGMASTEWLQGLEQGRSDVITALLLFHLSNLRSMKIRLRSLKRIVPLSVGKNISLILTRSPLKVLQSVEVSSGNVLRGGYLITHISNPYQMFSFIYAQPTLSHLQISHIIQPPSFRSLGFSPPNPASLGYSLKNLHLRGGILHDYSLILFLHATPYLEKLDVIFNYPNDAFQTCSSAHVKKALVLVKDTLRSLHISLSTIDRTCSNVSIPETLGSMRQFTKLERLHLPAALLVPPSSSVTDALTDILPTQLKYFGMSGFPFPAGHSYFSQELDDFWGNNFKNRRWYYIAREEMIQY